MEKNKVLILGGGPTALAAGVRLAKAGVRVKMIERLPWAGGLSKTFEHGPYQLDLGPHRFTPHSREVYDFVAEELGIELTPVRYQAEILVGDTFLSYPFRLSEFLTRMPPSRSARLVFNYAAAALMPNKKGEVTYEEWVGNRFGKGVTELIFRPLVEKVWGTPLSELSARFARQRIATASLWEIAWEVLSGRRHPRFHSPFYPDNGFLYPVLGYGTIVDRMAEEIQKAGGAVETGATVKEIQVQGDRIESVVYEKEGQTHVEPAEFVISTIPIQYFIQIAKPALPAPLLQASRNLKTRRLILLFLVLKKDRFSKNTSLYFPSSEFPFGRAWEQKNHNPRMIRRPDRTVLGIEIPCWPDDGLWPSDDQAVLNLALPPLERLKLLKRDEIEEFFTVRLGHVYPVWDVHFEKNLKVLLDWERKVENLIFNGRPGLFFYNNIHHSLDMGFRSADHVLSGKSKAEKWELDAKTFETFSLVE